MRLIQWVVVIGIFIFGVSFTTNSTTDWSNGKLNYGHFKATAPKNIKSTNLNQLVKVVYISNISISKLDGKISGVKLTNEINENESWIINKNQKTLRFAQVQFDISEYHIRLARKKIKVLIDKKKASENQIQTIIAAELKERDKAVRNYATLCGDQESLIRLYEENYSDSLKLTSAWAL